VGSARVAGDAGGQYFLVTALICVCVQSGAPSSRFYRDAGLLCLLVSILLTVALPLPNPIPGSAEAEWRAHAKYETPEAERAAAEASAELGAAPRPNPLLDWACFVTALLAAVLLGRIWDAASGVRCIFWRSWSARSSATHGWRRCACLLRRDRANCMNCCACPWPAPAPGRTLISLVELAALAAILEAARQMRLHRLSIVLGSAAGFCGGAFLRWNPGRTGR